MDIERYITVRGDLIARVLLDEPVAYAPRDRWIFGAGALCLVSPMILGCWASKSLVDPGYFARFSNMMTVVFVAGILLLVCMQATYALLGRTAITSRHELVERTLGQLLKIDASIVHRSLRREAVQN